MSAKRFDLENPILPFPIEVPDSVLPLEEYCREGERTVGLETVEDMKSPAFCETAEWKRQESANNGAMKSPYPDETSSPRHAASTGGPRRSDDDGASVRVLAHGVEVRAAGLRDG